MFTKTKLLPATSKHCVVVDMDDTLCLYQKNPGLPGCESFLPNEGVLASVLAHQGNGLDIVVATARSVSYEGKTLAWLSKWGVQVHSIYMRNTPITDPDYTPHSMKGHMLTDISKQHEIVGFYDDSPWNICVADSLGIPTIFIPGNEEYWNKKALQMGWEFPEVSN